MTSVPAIRPILRTRTTGTLAEHVSKRKATVAHKILTDHHNSSFDHVTSPLSATTLQDTTLLAANEAAWMEIMDSLEPWERRLYVKKDVVELPDLLSMLQKDSQQQTSASKSVRFAGHLRPVIRAVQAYSPLVSTASAASPVPVTAILGAVQCLLNIPQNFLEIYESLISDIEYLEKQTSRLVDYQHQLFPNNKQIQTILFEIFKGIFQYLRQAVRLFYDKHGKRTTGKIWNKALYTTYGQNIEPLKKKIKLASDEFEGTVSFLIRLKDDQFQSKVLAGHEEIKEIKDMVKQLMGPSSQSFQSVEVQRSILAGLSMDASAMRPSRSVLPAATGPTVTETYKLEEKDKTNIMSSWLPYIDFESEHKRNSAKLNTTGQWIFQDERLTAWKDGTDVSRVLTIQGVSGSGKSFLAASVFDRLSSDGRSSDVIVLRVYCKAMNPSQANASYIFGSLIHQVLMHSSNWATDPALCRAYFKSGHRGPTEEELKELAKAMMSKFRKVFVVLDAIDECRRTDFEKFGDLCASLHDFFMNANDSIYLSCFVRPNYELFDKYFADFPRIDIDGGANIPDMRLFIEMKLFNDDSLFRTFPGLKQDTEDTLIAKAKGVFLYLDRLLPGLKGLNSEDELLEQLDALPLNMSEHYVELVNKILHEKSKVRKVRALKILIWVCNAHRSIARNEMIELLAIKPNTFAIDSLAQIGGRGFMTSDCHDLVFVQDELYHPMHKSLIDWLHELDVVRYPQLHELGNLQQKAHLDIALTCLTYLQFDAFRRPPCSNEDELEKFLSQYPFYNYASNFWGFHVQHAGSDHPVLESAIEEFLSDSELRNLAMQVGTHRDRFGLYTYWCHPNSTPLHLLAMFDLLDTARNWHDVQDMLVQANEYGLKPLDYALAAQNKNISLWLLERAITNGVDLQDMSSEVPLAHSAALCDWPDVIDLLCKQRFDVDQEWGNFKVTPLHIACQMGFEQVTSSLIRAGARLEFRDDDNRTPLLVAAESGRTAIIGQLVDVGADVNVTGPSGFTVLHILAERDDVKTVKKLLAKSADPRIPSDVRDGGRLAMHVAAAHNAKQVLRELLSVCDVDAKTDQKWTALMLAIDAGSQDAVRLLLSRNASLNQTNRDGFTALHIAAHRGYTEIVHSMCVKSIELLNIFGIDGVTALMLAIIEKHAETALLLLEEFDADVRQMEPGSPRALHDAIEVGLFTVIDAILKRHPSEAHEAGYGGYTALHCAATYGRASLVERLVVQHGVKLDQESDSKQTVVHIAAAQNDLEFLEEIYRVQCLYTVSQTVDFAATDHEEKTGLHYAAEASAVECVRFLLERGVTSTHDMWQNTPFHLAASHGNLDCLKLLAPSNVDVPGYQKQSAILKASMEGHKHIVQYLTELDPQPDINAPDLRGLSPLHAAIEDGKYDIAAYLIEQKALVNTRSHAICDCVTPLHSSVTAGSYQITRTLLEQGSDGNARDSFGNTPFFLAVLSGNLRLVKVFVEHRQYSLTTKDVYGSNCFHAAASSGSVEMLEFLINLDQKDNSELHNIDLWGRTVMFSAAQSGNVSMVRKLHNLGVAVNGKEEAERRPLNAAAQLDDLNMLAVLLELGANVNAVDVNHNSALMAAIKNKSPQAVAFLCGTGVDETIEDIFGRNAQDLFLKSQTFWNRYHLFSDTRPERASQEKTRKMFQGVLGQVRQILQLEDSATMENLRRRLDTLDNIHSMLMELPAIKHDFEPHYIMISSELANLPISLPFQYPWECALCDQVINLETKWICVECSACLCSSCRQECLDADGSGSITKPQSRTTYELLEMSIQPVRELSARCGLSLKDLQGAHFEVPNSIEKWVDEKWRSYNDWITQYESTGRWQDCPKPGLEYLKILKILKNPSATKAAADSSGSSTITEIIDNLGEKLQQNYRMYPPHKKLDLFHCTNHRYIAIPHIERKIDDLSYDLLEAPPTVTHDEFESLENMLVEEMTELNLTPYASQIEHRGPASDVLISNVNLEPGSTLELNHSKKPSTALTQLSSTIFDSRQPHGVVTDIDGVHERDTKDSQPPMDALRKSSTQASTDPHGQGLSDIISSAKANIKAYLNKYESEAGHASKTFVNAQSLSQLEESLITVTKVVRESALYRDFEDLDNLTTERVMHIYKFRNSLRNQQRTIWGRRIKECSNSQEPEALQRLRTTIWDKERLAVELAFNITQIVQIGVLSDDLFDPGETLATFMGGDESD